MEAVSSTPVGDIDLPFKSQSTSFSTVLSKSLSALNLPRNYRQVGLAKSSGASGRSDSGYASVEGGSIEGSSASTVSNAIQRNPFQRKVTKLKPFNKNISNSTQNRFKDLNELFGQSLCKYLKKAKLSPDAISIKLKVLGESETTAKPWVVILCDETVAKKVKQFFKQQHVKSEYQPCITDSDIPSLEVYVCDRPPRAVAATAIADVYGDSWGAAASLMTLCGKVIKVVEPYHTRFATLGGIIKITDWQQNSMLFGMTAGHILAQGRPEEDKADLYEDRDDAEENEPDSSSDEEEEKFEINLRSEDELTTDDEDDQSMDDKGRTLTMLQGNDQSSTQVGAWPKMGYVSVASRKTQKDEQDLDWALIVLDDSLIYRPNMLIKQDVNHEVCTAEELKEWSSEIGGFEPGQPVILLSGTSGSKQGKLSPFLSLLILVPGKSFVSTYNLTLDDGSGEILSDSISAWLTFPS